MDELRLRAGKIVFHEQFMSAYDTDLIKAVFKHLVTFDVEHNHYRRQIIYIVYCPEFDVTERNQRLPEYKVEVTVNENEEYSISFKKKEHAHERGVSIVGDN